MAALISPGVLIFYGLAFLFPYCLSEDVRLQIISPRNDIIQGQQYRLSRSESVRGYDLDLYPDITFTSGEKPTPEEILNLFCDTVFPMNVSVLMNINLQESTVFSDYILSLAERLGYPVISWNPLYRGTMESSEHNMVLQMAPTIYHECQAMFEICERYNWTDFSVVTMKDVAQDFLECIDLMVEKTSTMQGYLKKARYTNLATAVIDLGGPIVDGILTPEQEVAVRDYLSLLIKAKSRIILFHAKYDDVLPIMEVAEDMGLTGAKYGWIVTSSAIGPVSSISRTKLPLGLLGIKAFQNKEDRILEDIPKAIKVFKEAITAAARSRDAITFAPQYDCFGPIVPWVDGKRLFEFMKEVSIKKRGEPPLSFMENGLIEQTELYIYNIKPAPHLMRRRERRVPKAWQEVGKIVPRVDGNDVEMEIETNDIMWPGHSLYPPKSAPEKRSFRVVTKKEVPFVDYIPPDEETGQCGHHAVPCKVNVANTHMNESGLNGTIDYCCTGLCIEIMELLAQKMNFEYELYDVPDGQWGVQDQDTGEWNGLIKEVLDEQADMVLTAFIVNQMRSKVLDFSVPYLESGITIMVSIRKGAISPTAFLEPYDIYSWILILIFSVHATGASIFIFEWLSPCGLAQGKTPIVEHKFSLFRSFWLIWAMLFGAAVSVDVPRGVSSRFLANVWALFALVFLASYTANLAAFMITIDEFYDLSGIEDWRLLNPTKLTPHFKFATISNSSSDVNLKFNYPRMHKYMSKYNLPDVESAIASLKNNSIHAFIYDANVLEYTAGRDADCSLLTVGRWYAMSGYGIGLPRGSKLRTEMNEILLRLQYSGEIERLQAFWLSGACHAKKDKKDKTSNKIGILNFISAFILLAAGVLLGVVLLILEHLYFKSGRKCLKKYDKCGCCALVSLSMGKSLTFEQSVLETLDIQRKHKCKDPVCEMHLWKARHQLDMALLKVRQLQSQIDDAKSSQAIAQPSYVALIESESVA